MRSFLYYVAKDLIGRYGNNLSDVTIVFPGKRAELYMNSFLSHFAQGPVWAPRFLTIDELFQRFSDLTPCDTIVSVCRLYKIYASLVTSPLSLDDFYGWGEILMNDFNDIDKHMVDAEKLFTNGADLAALDNVDFLSEEQTEALRQFFANFDPQHQSLIKKRFLEMWQAMPQMYKQLKEDLRKDNLMYKGALYREVVEKMKNNPYPLTLNPSSFTLHPSCTASVAPSGRPITPIFCFVGFNVLDEVEEVLFQTLRDSGNALFYWDYDVYYAAKESTHEAGLFLRHNLAHYPCALPDDIYDNLISPDKKICILSTTTDNAQVRYLPQWLEEDNSRNGNSTAIVLCDEALIHPAMHTFPSETRISPQNSEGKDGLAEAMPSREECKLKVNITMGFPLTDTAIYGYFSALFDLQTEGFDPELKRFRNTALERVEKNPFFTSFPADQLPLQHPTDNLGLLDWLAMAIESLGKQLSQSLTPTPYDQVYAETAFQLYRTLGQFRRLVANGTLQVQQGTLRRLVRQALATASIPFHGEMDEGLQVMGLLEARNLDFQHLILLSVGEGIIPRRSNESSMIPYILRAHFGLDTTERQDAVYAYSFYRLLQRAEDITLVYNSNSSGTAQREQSRFLRQLEMETALHIEHLSDSQLSAFSLQSPITVEKDERIMQRLLRKRALSPTAINQYIECPLSFYYQQVANLRIPDRPQDGIDARHFGTIFHDTCETFYTHLCHLTGRKEVLRSDLAPFTMHNPPLGSAASPVENLSTYLDLMFWADFFHASEYDSHEHPQEREEFLAPFLHANSREELSEMVDNLYTEGKSNYFMGINIIIHDVLMQLVRQLLRWDMEHTPFTIYGMEVDKYTTLTIPSGDKEITLTVGGRIDRMDIMNVNGQPTLRVVDYKTGKAKKGPVNIEGIFDSSVANAHGYYLQTFLYSLIMSRNNAVSSPMEKTETDLPVAPCLFYVLDATDSQQYDPILKLGKDAITDIRDVADEYIEGLRRVLSEIYDPTRPFVQAEDTQKHCEYCDFRRLCGR